MAESSDVRVCKLGSGTYGDVWLLKNGCAGKYYKGPSNRGEGIPRDAVKEIAILNGCSHAHVVKMCGVRFDGVNVCCLTEYAPCGDLRDYFKATPQWKAQKKSGVISYQIFSALAYLHARGVVHRDVKPENFLVFNTDSFLMKIADFGSALIHHSQRAESDSEHVLRTDPVSSLWYRAPEILCGLSDMQGPAMDVWAAGAIVCEACHPTAGPIFAEAKNEKELGVLVCAMFGTPDEENNIMPSLTIARREGRAVSPPMSGFVGLPRKAPQDTHVYPEWAEEVLAITLVLEPSKRASALTCDNLIIKKYNPTVVYPKTPKTIVPLPHTRDFEFRELRSYAGEVLFDSCIGPNFDRRAFHTAARVLDMETVHMRRIDFESRMGLLCGASASIGSKLCETYGIDPNLGPDLRYNAVQNKMSPRGLGKFPNVKVEDVVEEEARILTHLKWDVWDVLVIDAPVPPSVKAENRKIYDCICDLMVTLVGTNECSPHEMAEIAGLLTSITVDPKGQKVFPSLLMGVLQDFANMLNSPEGLQSCVRSVHEGRRGVTVTGRIFVDMDRIQWISNTAPKKLW